MKTSHMCNVFDDVWRVVGTSLPLHSQGPACYHNPQEDAYFYPNPVCRPETNVSHKKYFSLHMRCTLLLFNFISMLFRTH